MDKFRDRGNPPVTVACLLLIFLVLYLRFGIDYENIFSPSANHEPIVFEELNDKPLLTQQQKDIARESGSLGFSIGEKVYIIHLTYDEQKGEWIIPAYMDEYL